MATLILRDTYSELMKEMESLDKQKRETSEKIREAASHGDLKENGEYHAARELQSLIVYKKQLMQSHSPFKIIENGEIDTDTVGFGNKIFIQEEGKEKTAKAADEKTKAAQGDKAQPAAKDKEKEKVKDPKKK